MARGAEDMLYLFSLDRDHDPRVVEVINELMPSDRFQRRIAKRKHEYRGTAYNFMETYRDAYLCKSEIVYTIEDDILVSEDYFEFHEAAHELDDEAVCVSACRNQNLGRKIEPTESFFSDIDYARTKKLHDTGDLSAVYRHISYQSIGVSMKTDLMCAFLEHACRAYYDNQIDYCTRVLNDPDLPAGAASQDGLIHRVMRKNLWWTIYPFVPRAYHAGFVGFNRRNGRHLAMPWREGMERILEMSEREMNAAADPEFADIEQCELARSAPAELRVVELPSSMSTRAEKRTL